MPSSVLPPPLASATQSPQAVASRTSGDGLRTETVLMGLKDDLNKNVSPVWFFILLAVVVLVLVFLILG